MASIEQDDISTGNGSTIPPPMDAERAAAIAEVSIMSQNTPFSTAAGSAQVGGGGGGNGPRANNEADEALLAGDVQSLDEAGVQVRSLFLEFLYQL